MFRCRCTTAFSEALFWLVVVLLSSGGTLLAGHEKLDEENRFLWAYRPPGKHSLPAVGDQAWACNEIDRFIFAALEAKGLKPVERAGSSVLARRIHLALTGLPPTPKQLDEFERAGTEDDLARIIDQLLASPQFGERWGRHWLDVVRYAESMTLRGLIFKEAWRYRDYVIESFNRDVPFDRFIQEQIAGDLLPLDSIEDQRRARIATTFLALGNINLEEQDKKQLDMDVVDEQLDTIGKAFLGQTIGCARCHDHKFDPVSAEDYYAMAGILRSVQTLEHANVSKWFELPLPLPPEQEERLQRHEARLKELQNEIRKAREQAKKLGLGAGESNGAVAPISPAKIPGVVVDDTRARRVGEWVHSTHSRNFVGDGYIHDGNQDKGQKTVTFPADGLRAGRYEIRLSYTHSGNRSARVPVSILHADGEVTVHINQQESPPIDGRFISLGEYRFEANGQGFVLISNEGTTGHVIADAVQFLPVDERGLTVARAESQSQSQEEEHSALERQKLQEKIKQLEDELKRLTDTGPRRELYMSVKESSPRDIPLHKRGSVHNLGAVVPRGFMHSAVYDHAPAIPRDQSGRLQLAEWIASPANPLTARVIVNRVWTWLFGFGLVRTPDNFGTTGDLPSHPELLDYLAVRFMEEGWSIKKLVRKIVLSQTYQLSSAPQPGGLAARAEEIDPENRLLWRAHRRRMEAEVLRDAILFVSGSLKLELGGATIKPGTSVDYGYVDDDTRRSVYVPVFRNAVLELFEAFDFANPSMVTGRREVSTVAQQALYLMNHPFVMEQSRRAATRFLALAASDDSARVEQAYLITLNRAPTAREKEIALSYLSGPAPEGGGAPVDLWTQFAQALFASLDFRYID